MTTQERVYLDAQNACGLKVGDYVKVIRKPDDNEAGWDNTWPPTKRHNVIGEVGIIAAISGCEGIVVYFPSKKDWLHSPYFVLEKVEKPKRKFEPFDRVLVRNREDDPWEPDIFRFYGSKGGLLDDPDMPFYCMADCWGQCIPYEGNEHLVGTTDNPE